MKSSYTKEDVIILLKDVTGMIEPLDTAQREKRIQSGIHYSEMLPLEYKPSSKYIELYKESLNLHAKITAVSIKNISEKIIKLHGKDVVIVSLARAGTPIGILIKRYIKKKYNIDVFHYTISIIRGRGIDNNAMKYILKRHKAKNIQFVDGWIGKGAIISELKKELKNYSGIDERLAVVANPSGLPAISGTTEDFLIPSACLNAPVSGLFSRTILNSNIIGENDFHGAVYLENLKKYDVSYDFINTIEKHFDDEVELENKEYNEINEAENIARHFDISDINFIKPGIGETTRVLLRRVPWKVLVKDINDNKYIGHIKQLCKEKNVEILEYPLIRYRACGIIKNLNSDI